MNNYRFEAWQRTGVGTCYVTVFRNDEVIEQYEFATPEWAAQCRRTFEALDNTRPFKFLSVTGVNPCWIGGSGIDSTYTKEEVDALLQRITSLARWGERGRA